MCARLLCLSPGASLAHRGGRADALVMMCGVISSGVMMRSEKVIDIELEISARVGEMGRGFCSF